MRLAAILLLTAFAAVVISVLIAWGFDPTPWYWMFERVSRWMHIYI